MREGTGDVVAVQVAFRGYVRKTDLDGGENKLARCQRIQRHFESGKQHLHAESHRSALLAICGVSALNKPIAVAVISGGES